MSTATRTRSRVKPLRKIRLAVAPTPTNPMAILTITSGKEAADYFCSPLASDFGMAFRLEKFGAMGGEVYAVNLDGPHSTCECLGFLRWGHCKHVDALQALRKAGKLLPLPTPASVPDRAA